MDMIKTIEKMVKALEHFEAYPSEREMRDQAVQAGRKLIEILAKEPAPVQEPIADKRCIVVESCKSCKHSIGRLTCSLANRDFDSLVRADAPPEWCPLPLHTTPSAAQPAPVRPQTCGTGFCSCGECMMKATEGALSVRNAANKVGPVWEAFNVVYEAIADRPITVREIAWRCFLAAQPAKQEQGEPVGYCSETAIDRLRQEPGDWMMIYGKPQYPHKVPLYAAPQQRKPLMPEQIETAVRDWHSTVFTELEDEPSVIDIARAIEAAHGIVKE